MKAPLASVHFEGFRLDPRSRLLVAPDGQAVTLTAKAYDVLVYLIEHAERVVGKDELLDRVWRGRVVEENNLNQAVSALRRALGTGVGDRRFIITVPGQGYRFVAEVHGEPAASATDRPRTRTPGWARMAVFGAFGLALGLPALVWVLRTHSPALLADDPTTVRTLVVLPFLEVPGDPGDDLLTMGLAETLITRLGLGEGLRVRTLAASQRASAIAVDPLAAARSLGADYVVEGSTQRRENQVRVNIRLLQRDRGELVWGQTYDVDPAQVFALQDRIAGEILASLRVSPAPMLSMRTSPCDGADIEAYRAYLTGLRQVQAPSPASLRSAVGAFERAISLDPACARAWAGLAFVWRTLALNGDLDPRETFPLASTAVDRALTLDPDLAEAYSSRGFIHFWHTWDWTAAEASFQHSIRLNPSLPEARLGYAHLLSNLGRHDEALEQARVAVELDPLWPLINALTAAFLRAADRHEEALAQIESARELAPDFWIPHVTRASILLDLNQPDRAIVDLERADELSIGSTQALSLLGMAYARSGREEDAEAMLDRMMRRADQGYIPATSLATVHNALGREEVALALLERALEERDVRLAFLKVDARWNNLRGHQRFIELARRVNLEH